MANETPGKHVIFDEINQSIRCVCCGQETPIHRSTSQRNAFRFAEEMQMARELHRECPSAGSKRKAQMNVQWRSGWLYATNDRGDKLVYRA